MCDFGIKIEYSQLCYILSRIFFPDKIQDMDFPIFFHSGDMCVLAISRITHYEIHIMHLPLSDRLKLVITQRLWDVKYQIRHVCFYLQIWEFLSWLSLCQKKKWFWGNSYKQSCIILIIFKRPPYTRTKSSLNWYVKYFTPGFYLEINHSIHIHILPLKDLVKDI